MEPTNFLESNRIFAKPHDMTDEQCSSLPVHDTGMQLISCWKVSWKERLKILIDGRIWLWIWSRGQPPVSLDTKNPFKD